MNDDTYDRVNPTARDSIIQTSVDAETLAGLLELESNLNELIDAICEEPDAIVLRLHKPDDSLAV